MRTGLLAGFFGVLIASSAIAVPEAKAGASFSFTQCTTNGAGGKTQTCVKYVCSSLGKNGELSDTQCIIDEIWVEDIMHYA